MKKLVFSGCSLTAGSGWDYTDPSDMKGRTVKNSPYLWTNLCHKNIHALKDLEQVNIAVPGGSNAEIFKCTVRSMVDHGSDIDTIFCQWTSMPRYTLNVGFELWDTQELVLNKKRSKEDINLNRGNHYPRKYVDDLLDRFATMHHLHWEILLVLEYTNIISKLAKTIGIKKCFFINGICPWDQNYFLELKNVKPEAYTPFTKKEILNIGTRDDEDIYKLYSIAHQHYRDTGGVNEEEWINLYNSMVSLKTDVNFDGSHPGEQSNQQYYKIIEQRLQELGYI